jgi:hypothetical protein
LGAVRDAVEAGGGRAVRPRPDRMASGWAARGAVLLSAMAAAASGWHAALQLPSDVRNYHQWILGPLPSWDVAGPYPVVADALWWPLRWFHGTNINPWWLLGWTGPATVAVCVLLWRTASRPAVAVSVWLLAAAILERSYWMRLEPIAALLTLAMVVGVRRGRVAGPALALSLGSLIKVWPVFLVPTALLALTARARIRWLAWFTLPWAMFAVAVAALRPASAITWFTFTVTRRTQAESLAALPALWATATGSHTWRVTYVGGLDSADVVIGPDLTTIHLILEGVGLALLTLLAGRLIRWLRARGEIQPGTATPVLRGYAQTALLLVVIFAGPVLSPQYLVWFAPVLVVAVGERQLIAETVIWLVACVLTSIEFPFLWADIRNPQPFAVGVLTLRDLVLLGLLGRCVRRIWWLTSPARPTGSAPAD